MARNRPPTTSPASVEPGDPDVLHNEAVARGQRFYVDRETGLFVMTRLAHLDRGRCCGSGCRHCPYDPIRGELNPS